MDFYRKILILFIILIFTYIIFRLILKRIQMKQEYENVQIEGYENETVNSIQKGYDCNITIKNDLQSRIKNIQDNSGNYLPDALYLRNYAVKSSMNTAYNGKENNTDMINYVLSRGCRFLDFEVFNDSETSTAVVSVSKSHDSNYLPLDTVLSLSDALRYTNMYCFNLVCPNYNDPLFIQIRPKLNTSDPNYESNKKSISSKINDSVVQNLSPLYSKKVTGMTPLNELINKIIVVMDTTTFTDCSNIVQLANNSLDSMTTLSYGNLSTQYELKLKSDMYTCDVSTITQIIFEDASKVSYNTNVNTDILFQNYSSQILPMMYWNTGGDLCNYESLFNTNGCGIIPLSFIYNELKKTNEKYIQYPDPLFAFSNYGSQTTTIFIIIACLGIVGFIVMKENT